MSAAMKDQTDPRSRYGHQAYDVTTMGMSPETGSLGYDRRVSATYAANMQIELDVSVATEEFNIPPYVMILGYSIPIPVVGGTAPVLTIAVSDLDDSNQISIAAGVDPSIVTRPTDGVEIGAAENKEKKVKISLTANGATGNGVVLLQAQIVETAWK